MADRSEPQDHAFWRRILSYATQRPTAKSQVPAQWRCESSISSCSVASSKEAQAANITGSGHAGRIRLADPKDDRSWYLQRRQNAPILYCVSSGPTPFGESPGPLRNPLTYSSQKPLHRQSRHQRPHRELQLRPTRRRSVPTQWLPHALLRT